MIISAPAKLNRFLAITGKRLDGYHDLELITTVLDGVKELNDTLEAEIDSKISLEIDGPQSKKLIADDSNLILKAWKLLELTVKQSLPAKIKLHKRIPYGAGLGGGSSNAAAALILGNELFNLSLSTSSLIKIGAQIGSDVPLFLIGGTVLGLGRGDRVFPLADIPLEPILIIYPGLHLLTASVYQAIAKIGYHDPTPCLGLPKHTTPPWRNDLTDAAIWTCPPLGNVQKAIIDSGGEPLLCGSGSCWAARYSSNHMRDKAHEYLNRLNDSWQIWHINN